MADTQIVEENPVSYKSLLNDAKYDKSPKMIDEYLNDKLIKRIQWSPSGDQLLSLFNDGVLSVFDFSQDDKSNPFKLKSKWNIADVSDFSWCPNSNSKTSSFATVICDQVYVADQLTQHLTEYERPNRNKNYNSVSFNSCGEMLFCGSREEVHVFEVGEYEEPSVVRPTLYSNTFNDERDGQPGDISCFAFNPSNDCMYACGSHSKTVGIYFEPQGCVDHVLEGHKGEVTQLKFSKDGHLYSSALKESHILCWGMRQLWNVVFEMERQTEELPIYFDLDPSGLVLMSGSHNGMVYFWDVSNKGVVKDNQSNPILSPFFNFKAHTDTVTSISCHPTKPIFATAGGNREHLPHFSGSGDDGETDVAIKGSIKLWEIY